VRAPPCSRSKRPSRPWVTSRSATQIRSGADSSVLGVRTLRHADRRQPAVGSLGSRSDICLIAASASACGAGRLYDSQVRLGWRYLDLSRGKGRCEEGFGIHRLAIAIALALMTAVRGEEGLLRPRLDALCDDFKPQAAGERQDRFNDSCIVVTGRLQRGRGGLSAALQREHADCWAAGERQVDLGDSPHGADRRG